MEGVEWEMGSLCIIIHSHQASPVTPHGRAEVFEVQLQVLSLNTAFPSQVNMMSERSLIEPMGILQLANTMYTALEGETVWDVTL